MAIFMLQGTAAMEGVFGRAIELQPYLVGVDFMESCGRMRLP